MTQDEIIEMARQAGIQDAYSNFPHKGVIAQLEAFAKLVAAKATASEREACAKVCESIYTNGDGAECWLENAASKIRARGEQA